MEAIEYLKVKARLCILYACGSCPLGKEARRRNYTCDLFERDNPEECVRVIENWNAEGPKKTRQSKFLKVFPNASLDDNGIIEINPCYTDVKFRPQKGCVTTCFECREEYWNEEIAEVE